MAANPLGARLRLDMGCGMRRPRGVGASKAHLYCAGYPQSHTERGEGSEHRVAFVKRDERTKYLRMPYPTKYRPLFFVVGNNGCDQFTGRRPRLARNRQVFAIVGDNGPRGR